MKISDTNQQINRKQGLSKVDSADKLDGRKITKQKLKNNSTVTESAAIKSDTVQLSPESLTFTNSVKAESSDKVIPNQKVNSENSLVELLKKADKQSGIFGSRDGISKGIDQKNSDNTSGSKIDFLL
ncbi:MAG: hypothetical protein GY775_10790 [Candidatus Scalindua sp.]|nr:hypothetical protein [Candidatus Scalindua sp.]